MVDVALFPIPDSVNFPGIPCPLHVFEPRYRKMVRHCLDENMLMGVCHTEKMVHSSPRQQSLSEALNSNQSTYKPRSVFSAGPVSLLEELEDGRLLIEVDTAVRLQLREEKQILPFSIWACEELPDVDQDEQAARDMEQLKEKILQRLLVLTHDNAEAQGILNSEHWQAMPARDFSFAVAGLVGMPADLAQQLLEKTEAVARLATVLDLINGMHSG